MTAQILIADDNPHIRHVIRHLIEQNPEWHVCGEATDGREVVRKARQLRPDLIVLDFLMPGMNGLEAAREISKTVPQTPMLMCTTYMSRQLTDLARRSGLQGAVCKAAIEQLRRGVERLLRHETFFAAN